MDIQRSLSEIGDRLTKARNDLRIVDEQLLFQMDVVEDAKTRMLVAETPLADREYRIARDDHDRMARQRAEVHDRDRRAPAGAGPASRPHARHRHPGLTPHFARRHSFKAPRILIAEDEAIIRLDLKEMLEEEGLDVVGEASDGEAAIRLAREHGPDLVIMDIKMPGMDGLAAAERSSRRGSGRF